MPGGIRRRRRWWIPVLVGGLVVLLAVGVEFGARALVSNIAVEQVQNALPEQIGASVNAAPTGNCVSCEIVMGRLSGLDLTSDDVTFGEAKGSVAIAAEGVQIASPNQVESLTGQMSIAEADLNALVSAAAANAGIPINSLSLEENKVRYRTDVAFFGQTIAMSVAASVRVQPGGWVEFVAQDLEASALGFDLGTSVSADQFSYRVCVAEQLPSVLTLSSVEVHQGRLNLGVRSNRSFMLNEQSLSEHGHCA